MQPRLTKAEAAKRELDRRARRARFDPIAICHPKQAAVVADPSRNLVVVAGRQSGKSFVAVLCALLWARSTERCNVVYVSATYASVKKMAWQPLLAINREYALGGHPNYTELSMSFPNGSTIYLLGVDSEKSADKARGIPRLVGAIVDECARYDPDVLRYLLRDVIRPGLRPMAGRIMLAGTPSPLGKVGPLWEARENPAFSHHTWDAYDNTKVGTREQIEKIIEDDLKTELQGREGAWFRREYLAEWVVDEESRVYHFDEDRNTYDQLPNDLNMFACAGDIGVRDADAMAIVGWNDDRPDLYLVEEVIRRGQDALDMGVEVERVWNTFNPIVLAFDGGGGGLKTILTIQHLYPNAPIKAVDKPNVNMQVKALNQLLRRLKVRRGSRFYEEVRNSEWLHGIVNGRIREYGHSDIVPAMRYLAVEVLQYLPGELEVFRAPPPSLQDRYREQAVREARRVRQNGGIQGLPPVDDEGRDYLETTEELPEPGWNPWGGGQAW